MSYKHIVLWKPIFEWQKKVLIFKQNIIPLEFEHRFQPCASFWWRWLCWACSCSSGCPWKNKTYRGKNIVKHNKYLYQDNNPFTNPIIQLTDSLSVSLIWEKGKVLRKHSLHEENSSLCFIEAVHQSAR